MGEALAEMVAAAETHGCYSAKEHLYPAHNWHDLADDTVSCDDGFADSAVYALCEVKLEVDADGDLSEEHEHEGGGEGGVDVVGELAATVHVSEEVA